jgi:hypothetical protein
MDYLLMSNAARCRDLDELLLYKDAIFKCSCFVTTIYRIMFDVSSKFFKYLD